MRADPLLPNLLSRALIFGLVSLSLTACMGSTAEPPAPVVTPAATQETVAAEPEVIAPPAPPEPARLDALSPAAVLALMGEPGLVRRDGRVQVMLFEGDNCVYEVVFIEPTADDFFEVRHHSARTKEGADMDRASCLTQLLPGSTWPE